MPSQPESILKQITRAGYEVECRIIKAPGRQRGRWRRAIARDVRGIIAGFASATTDSEALAKLAQQLGLELAE